MPGGGHGFAVADEAEEGSHEVGEVALAAVYGHHYVGLGHHAVVGGGQVAFLLVFGGLIVATRFVLH